MQAVSEIADNDLDAMIERLQAELIEQKVDPKLIELKPSTDYVGSGGERVTDPAAIKQKLDALRELKREREKRDQEARARDYEDTIAERGAIPVIVLDGLYHGEQRERLLAELGYPKFWIECAVVDPPPAPEVVMPNFSVPTYFANTARHEATPSQEPTPPGPNASHCVTTTERGQPLRYLFDSDARTITLAEHNGAPTRIGGKIFQEALDRGANADEVAVTLWLRSRGKSDADFDGPIDYTRGALRLARGA
jgi:hypothetical protein